MTKKTRRHSEKSDGGHNGHYKVKLDLWSGGDTPHELLIKVEISDDVTDEETQTEKSMLVYNQSKSFQGTLTRCKGQEEAYDHIEQKVKEFGGHIGYFHVIRRDMASLEINTEQMIPVQNW